MWLSPRLWWQKRRLWKQPSRPDGRPLSDREAYELEVAMFALIDEDGTRRVAVDGEAAQMRAAEVLAAGEDGGRE